MFAVRKVPVAWLPPQVIRKWWAVNACKAREYHLPLIPFSARRCPATNTRCAPLTVDPGRLSKLEPANTVGSTSCASGRYVCDSLISTEHGFVSGAVYSRIACVE